MPRLSASVSTAIRRHRQLAGVSQEELADRAKLHHTYISLVERGKRNLSVDALDQIAYGLGVAASALIVEAERQRPRGR